MIPASVVRAPSAPTIGRQAVASAVSSNCSKRVGDAFVVGEAEVDSLGHLTLPVVWRVGCGPRVPSGDVSPSRRRALFCERCRRKCGPDDAGGRAGYRRGEEVDAVTPCGDSLVVPEAGLDVDDKRPGRTQAGPFATKTESGSTADAVWKDLSTVIVRVRP